MHSSLTVTFPSSTALLSGTSGSLMTLNPASCAIWTDARNSSSDTGIAPVHSVPANEGYRMEKKVPVQLFFQNGLLSISFQTAGSLHLSLQGPVGINGVSRSG